MIYENDPCKLRSLAEGRQWRAEVPTGSELGQRFLVRYTMHISGVDERRYISGILQQRANGRLWVDMFSIDFFTECNAEYINLSFPFTDLYQEALDTLEQLNHVVTTPLGSGTITDVNHEICRELPF